MWRMVGFHCLYFLLQWNGSITYSFEIERDFGTDYGICCWHTPQHNITLIHQDMIEHNHSEVHWGEWFQDVKKVCAQQMCNLLFPAG